MRLLLDIRTAFNSNIVIISIVICCELLWGRFVVARLSLALCEYGNTGRWACTKTNFKCKDMLRQEPLVRARERASWMCSLTHVVVFCCACSLHGWLLVVGCWFDCVCVCACMLLLFEGIEWCLQRKMRERCWTLALGEGGSGVGRVPYKKGTKHGHQQQQQLQQQH